MENTTISKDELNNLSKETIIFLFMQQSENLALIKDQYQTLVAQNEFSNEQMKALQKQITDLQEQISILTQHRFGARSEKNLPGQMTFDIDGNLIFNEAEALVPDAIPEESPIEQVITYTRKKTNGMFLLQISIQSLLHMNFPKKNSEKSSLMAGMSLMKKSTKSSSMSQVNFLSLSTISKCMLTKRKS